MTRHIAPNATPPT